MLRLCPMTPLPRDVITGSRPVPRTAQTAMPHPSSKARMVCRFPDQPTGQAQSDALLQGPCRSRLPVLPSVCPRSLSGHPGYRHHHLADNPKIGRLEERRHIGQLVTASHEEAEALRQRILNGESLYELTSQYSIDPYGREHKGDMGRQTDGSGHPAIEQAISKLEANQLSEIVETPMGFHLVSILERRPGGQKRYLSIRDRVRQIWITDQMASYMSQLAEQHRVVWHVVSDAAKE